jgi:hypothetical protein
VIASVLALIFVASASSAHRKGSDPPATRAIEKAHCTAGEVVSMNAAFVSGTVIGQHPAWGKTLAPGTAIGLTVSLGPR